MNLQKWWVRGSLIAVVMATSAVIGVHALNQPALAKSPTARQLAPKGCPTVQGGFSGLLAQSSDLKFQASAGFPPNTIELSSFQWGVGRGISSPTGASSDRWGIGRGISSPTGGSADREASAPSVSEIVVTKHSDQNDPLLVQQAAEGKPAGWTLWLYHVPAANGAASCESFTLENVFISGYSLSSGGDRPSESISLNFSKLTVTHIASNNSYVLTTPSTQPKTP